MERKSVLISPSLKGPTHLRLACTWEDLLLARAEAVPETETIEEAPVRILEIEAVGEVIDQDQGDASIQYFIGHTKGLTPVDVEITLLADVKDPTPHADIEHTKNSCATSKDLHFS